MILLCSRSLQDVFMVYLICFCACTLRWIEQKAKNFTIDSRFIFVHSALTRFLMEGQSLCLNLVELVTSFVKNCHKFVRVKA